MVFKNGPPRAAGRIVLIRLQNIPAHQAQKAFTMRSKSFLPSRYGTERLPANLKKETDNATQYNTGISLMRRSTSSCREGTALQSTTIELVKALNKRPRSHKLSGTAATSRPAL